MCCVFRGHSPCHDDRIPVFEPTDWKGIPVADADEPTDTSESGGLAAPFISYAQNGEDVVLHRALGDVVNGVFIDVGAADPVIDSVTWAFYQRGWSGINFEPVKDFADMYHPLRSRDTTIRAGVGAEPGRRTFYIAEGTGLSSLDEKDAQSAADLGYTIVESEIEIVTLNDTLSDVYPLGTEIHFLKIDAEGAEADVLNSIDLDTWRPWVILVEATRPNSTESTRHLFDHLITKFRYEPVLFDGLNQFYVAEEHRDLAPSLSYPACPLDDYGLRSIDVLLRENAVLRNDVSEASRRYQEPWSHSLSDLFIAQNDRDEAVRKLRIARRRALRAEERARAIESSKLGRVRATQLRVISKARRVLHRSPLPESMTARVPRKPVPDITVGAPDDVLQARLSAVLNAVGQSEDGLSLPKQLEALVDAIDDSQDPLDLLWLCAVTFNSALPNPSQVAYLHRTLTFNGARGVVTELLRLRSTSPRNWARSAPMEIVTVPLVDVTHTSLHNSHTGVQRVVREVVPRWVETQDFALAVLDEDANVWRPLRPAEEDRVLRWPISAAPTHPGEPGNWQSILVPWHTQFVSPELILETRRCEYILALAEYSGSDYCAIVYDLIPITMPSVCSAGIRTAFSNQLSAMSVSSRLSTISQSVELDVDAYSGSLANQGTRPLTARAHSLPVRPNPLTREQAEEHRAALFAIRDLPLVLSVSSIEPRKNQTSILLAAEQLWREGQQFQLLFIAGDGWLRDDFDAELKRAQDAGRPVRVISKASEELLWAAYQLARFSVFVSLAEGYGLPAAESIGSGTPVVLTNYGSMAEIGEAGGAAMVDPRSLGEITTAMRRLLSDDEYLELLRRETREYPVSTWGDYASNTWAWLTEGE